MNFVNIIICVIFAIFYTEAFIVYIGIHICFLALFALMLAFIKLSPEKIDRIEANLREKREKRKKLDDKLISLLRASSIEEKFKIFKN
jgi:hypothetical protein